MKDKIEKYVPQPSRNILKKVKNKIEEYIPESLSKRAVVKNEEVYVPQSLSKQMNVKIQNKVDNYIPQSSSKKNVNSEIQEKFKTFPKKDNLEDNLKRELHLKQINKNVVKVNTFAI